MTTKVYDLFDSEEEVKRTIDQLIEEGYQESDIAIVVKHFEKISFLRNRTNAHVHTDRSPAEAGGTGIQKFTERLKAAAKGEISFAGWDVDNQSKHLGEFGLTQEQREYYEKEIDKGKVLVLVPELPEENLAEK